MDSFEKVYPTEEELGRISKNRNCPECGASFNSESNLNLHLNKTHKKSNLCESNPNRIFYCPVVTCSYNNSAHFRQLKGLKQHFLKVHSEKKYICSLCKQGFATEAIRNRHNEYCDVVFKCCDCDLFYTCYETLKTHSRRKRHTILEKVAYKSLNNDSLLLRINPKSDKSLCLNKNRIILPKPSFSTGTITITDTSEQSCQTESNMNQTNQETQTLLMVRVPHDTVETQTIGDYFTRKTEQLNLNLKSTKTQTATPDPKTSSCNTSFSVDDFEINMMSEVQRNSSSTQTTIYNNEAEDIYSASTCTHDSIHTDTSDLLKDTFDSNFFNCNMETQTDFIFNDELLRFCDDYTNMYTQTCEELLLGEIGLNDIHTQTVFDDVLKSVESQTVMSQSRMVPLSCKDNVAHTETQTDMQYKQMLEEINA